MTSETLSPVILMSLVLAFGACGTAWLAAYTFTRGTANPRRLGPEKLGFLATLTLLSTTFYFIREIITLNQTTPEGFLFWIQGYLGWLTLLPLVFWFHFTDVMLKLAQRQNIDRLFGGFISLRATTVYILGVILIGLRYVPNFIYQKGVAERTSVGTWVEFPAPYYYLWSGFIIILIIGSIANLIFALRYALSEWDRRQIKRLISGTVVSGVGALLALAVIALSRNVGSGILPIGQILIVFGVLALSYAVATTDAVTGLGRDLAADLRANLLHTIVIFLFYFVIAALVFSASARLPILAIVTILLVTVILTHIAIDEGRDFIEIGVRRLLNIPLLKDVSPFLQNSIMLPEELFRGRLRLRNLARGASAPIGVEVNLFTILETVCVLVQARWGVILTVASDQPDAFKVTSTYKFVGDGKTGLAPQIHALFVKADLENRKVLDTLNIDEVAWYEPVFGGDRMLGVLIIGPTDVTELRSEQDFLLIRLATQLISEISLSRLREQEAYELIWQAGTSALDKRHAVLDKIAGFTSRKKHKKVSDIESQEIDISRGSI